MIERILVRSPNWIGDQVLAFPFFHQLRKFYPKAKITAVCVPWVRDLQFRGQVDEVLILPVLAEKGILAKWRHLSECALAIKKEGPFDLGILLPNSFSSAMIFSKAGLKRIRGYSTEMRGWLLNERLLWDPSPNRHRAQAYFDLLTETKQLETHLPKAQNFWGEWPENDLDEFVPGVLKEFEATLEWKGVEEIAPPSTNYWVLGPGATADSRRWSTLNFVTLAKRIYDETGWTGIIVGGPKEVAIAKEIADAVNSDGKKRVLDWTAQGSIASLWKIFRTAKVTVANESGLAHVASLCGSPVQIICGAADPRRTKPIGPGPVQVTVNAVECWPCEKNYCIQQGDRYLQCLRGIDPVAVWEEIWSGFRAEKKTPPEV